MFYSCNLHFVFFFFFYLFLFFFNDTATTEIYTLSLHDALPILCYYRGLYKLNSISIQKLFSEKFGPPQFSATMSRNRFLFILRHLSFDDEETRGERWKKDRFAAFRDFFESFNRNCITSLAPGDYLSLDETLYPMRTQIGFRQFNPNKPAKYGMLFKSVNAARMPYTFIAAPYTGKPVEQGGQFYVQGTEAIVVSLEIGRA